ncbi:MAG: hypothetical protein ABIF10_04345, partial [Candidatus Woesearchaeota archaeon]
MELSEAGNNLVEIVLDEVRRFYGVKVDEQTKPVYISFLKKELSSHPQYVQKKGSGFPYQRLLADTLFLYSVLTRRSAVQLNGFRDFDILKDRS